MINRLIVLAAVMTLPWSTEAASTVVVSDPAKQPYVDRYGNVGMGPGATVNMSREERRAYGARVQDELDAREKRYNENKRPPIKLNIVPHETPMPPLPSHSASPSN
jgi:hypothetical protein